jgi:signal transduction histidine kinase/GAF domain-containing protein
MEAKTYTATLENSAIVERVARIVSSVRGTKPDYIALAAELEQAIPFDVFGVVLLRHDRQAVRVTVCRREAGAWMAFHHQHPLTGSMLERVLAAPMLMVNNYPGGLDGLPATSGDALAGSPQLRSTLIAPLMVEKRVLGTLELGSVVANTYTDKMLQRLINAVAHVLAAAIESAQLGGSAAIQDRQRQVLKDVTSALTSKMDLATILNQIVVGVASTLNVASAIVMLDRREGRLSLVAQSGLDEERLAKAFNPQPMVRDDCIIGQTLQQCKPFVSHDITSDELFPASCSLFSMVGVRSVLSYPLMSGTTVFGALLLCSQETGGFTPLKADILSLFASQASVAIHNGILLESAQRRKRFQEAIEQLEWINSQNIAAVLNTAQVAEQAKEQSKSPREEQQEELELLAHVREETQRTFGVSLTSLLRFVSDHLLTLDERELQAIINTDQTDQTRDSGHSLPAEPARVPSRVEQQRAGVSDVSVPGRKEMFADTLILLTQSAEAALVRTGMVGELGRLIMQLKQSTSGVKDAWFVVDLNGTCIYMNPAAEALCEVRLQDLSVPYNTQRFAPLQGPGTSASIEHIFGNLLTRIRHADDVRLYLQDFTQGSAQRQELRFALSVEPIQAQARAAFVQAEAEHKPGRLEEASSDNHYQLIRYPLFDQHGNFLANVLQALDVTEQVRDEKNRSALLSSVSHDLRTPLTTIKAAVTGLLQEDVAWSEQDRRAMLEDIDTETDHLTVLVSALVELSRIEMGALILEKEWCDVVEVVYGTLAKMKRKLVGRSVCPHFQADLPLVYADHVQLERVFYNLLENALHHSPDLSEIIIKLDVVGEMLRAQVINYGDGIPEYERERIFKSFHSLRSYGDALGLAICRGIVEAHQGQIWVEAADEALVSGGTGSSFVFTLPISLQIGGPGGRETISSTGREISAHNASSAQRVHERAWEA